MHVPSRLAVSIATAVLLAGAGCSSAEDTAGSGDDTTPVETTESTTTEPTASSPTEDQPSESEETTEQSPTEQPPTGQPGGDAVQGTGFTIGLPARWEDVTAEAGANQPLVDLAIAAPSGKFRTNFNVVKPQPFSGSEQQLVEQSAEELRTVTNSRVEPVEPTTFDGVGAPGQTSTLATAQGDVTLIQYMVVRDEQIHPVTMTFLESKRADATATMDEIIASWQWDAG